MSDRSTTAPGVEGAGDKRVGEGDALFEDGQLSYRVVGFEELEGAAAAHYRRRWRRRLMAFVTLPGLVLATATIAGAYGTGLIGGEEVTCSAESVTAPDRDSFDIAVLNSSDTDGLATEVGHALTERGFEVTSVATADSSVYVKGVATIFHGSKGYDQALLLQKQFPGAHLWNDNRSGSAVQLVVGYGYRAMSSEAPPPPPLPAEIRVKVFNTTWQDGLASQVGDDLKERGYRVAETGNDPDGRFLPDESAVIHFGPFGKRAAEVLASNLDGVTLQQDDRTSQTVDLVLGSEFESLTPASAVPTPEPVPEVVETIERPCSTR